MDRILWEGNSDLCTTMPMGQTGKQAIADIRSQRYKTPDSPLLCFQYEITLSNLHTLCVDSGAAWMVTNPLGAGA